MAEFLGGKHTEQYISEQEMLNLVREIPQYNDEPFADPLQILTMLVSKFAKRDLTVVLPGDGGDEFLSGYNIYSKLQKAQKLDRWGDLLFYLRKMPMLGKRISAIQQILLNEGKSCYYPVETKYDVKKWDIRRMLLDMQTYLPDDILCKVDRASVKYALECRCPILDVNVMEYAYTIPQRYKNDNGNQKKFLKNQEIFHIKNTQKLVLDYLENGNKGKDSGRNRHKNEEDCNFTCL